MENLDRSMQRQILVALAERYPDFCSASELGLLGAEPHWTFHTWYLDEHGLCEAAKSRSPTDRVVHQARITARGLDFLQDDGGLSAILGVTVVRLEADTLRAMIERRIDAAALPAQDKADIKSALRSAGSEALAETTRRLVGAAIDRLPEAIALLRTQLG